MSPYILHIHNKYICKQNIWNLGFFSFHILTKILFNNNSKNNDDSILNITTFRSTSMINSLISFSFLSPFLAPFLPFFLFAPFWSSFYTFDTLPEFTTTTIFSIYKLLLVQQLFRSSWNKLYIKEISHNMTMLLLTLSCVKFLLHIFILADILQFYRR